MKFRWSMAPPQPLLAGQLAAALKLSPLLAQCLLNRGLDQAAGIRAFLEPRLRNLADPFLLPNMRAAVERLFAGRARNELVVIFGDYDVDGVTSTAILLETLTALGWRTEYYLPHRLEEGYGLSQEALENCLNKIPATLLIAVDCGTTAVGPIELLGARGVDVIVVDHHQPGEQLPAACALINPHLASRGDLPSPAQTPTARFTELCSAGLAFKLTHAIVKQGRQLGLAVAQNFDVRPLLDLVALGTVADLVPLTGENRILAARGLERLAQSQRPGLSALKRVAQCPARLGVYEVGFQLAPRLNAAGRLENAEAALRLLRAKDLAEAMPLAQQLDHTNRERQQIERSIAKEVISTVQAKFKPEDDFVIVEGQLPWHVGVVGIVAARVLQQFYRPTIIVGGDGAHWRGSGRSIPGFDLAAALSQCSDLLLRHGGHALAAGVSLHNANLELLRTRLNDLARLALKPEALQPQLRLDAEVGLDEVSLACVQELEQLTPIGQGNPPVHFVARSLTHQRPLQRLGADKQHVKMWITDSRITHEAVWWGAGQASLPVGRFDLAFLPQRHEYQGRRLLQLKVLDWRPAQ